MPRFTITLAYSVTAASRDQARVAVSEALRLGSANGVRMEFESVTVDPTTVMTEPKQGWFAWAEEARDQLLGPRKVRQQPAWKKAQS